ncbi:exported hypothetical protein [uncultured Gammaproteobacteria bacterium]
MKLMRLAGLAVVLVAVAVSGAAQAQGLPPTLGAVGAGLAQQQPAAPTLLQPLTLTAPTLEPALKTPSSAPQVQQPAAAAVALPAAAAPARPVPTR